MEKSFERVESEIWIANQSAAGGDYPSTAAPVTERKKSTGRRLDSSRGKIKKRSHGEQVFNVYVSHELKQRVVALAEKYERPMADMVRVLIRIGLPVLEGLNQAEEQLLTESVRLVKRLKKVRDWKKAVNGE